ncbi:MBL fold metallo-hydrolase [Alkalihalobacterium bogoriense]|uniref:MBL fold metallo-hydrolase n=1 Tax=Alkalihalobacterium bogoriense TaxID=246272 RepID=UPI000685334C|nr:MBL fold metallo-hydrolase [Alkalihalobacterium bogoriense]
MSSVSKIQQFGPVSCLRGLIKKLGRTFTYCVYYVDGLLIDTGPPAARKAVEAFVKNKKITAIVLTHSHEDHIGNAQWLADKYNIPVYMSSLTKKQLEQDVVIPFYRRLIWGKVQHTNGLVLETEIKTNHYHFTVIPTPGHCDGHIALLEPQEKWLFSGDLFLSKRLLYGMANESVPILLRSIKTVLKHDFSTVFCGHAGIVENGKESFIAKKEYLERLTASTLSLQAKGYSAEMIAKLLLPQQKLVSWFSKGEMSPLHLITSIINEHSIKIR